EKDLGLPQMRTELPILTKTRKNHCVIQGRTLCFFLVPVCYEASFGKPAPERNSLRSSGLNHFKKTKKTADA
ncbi:hypothetical protein, partial [Prevotella lacticifex]|uniref:hypothetical protein n=1 Tax=Prevotella lacticifex TaxID=2854755 RepID=UPI001CC78AC8